MAAGAARSAETASTALRRGPAGALLSIVVGTVFIIVVAGAAVFVVAGTAVFVIAGTALIVVRFGVAVVVQVSVRAAGPSGMISGYLLELGQYLVSQLRVISQVLVRFAGCSCRERRLDCQGSPRPEAWEDLLAHRSGQCVPVGPV